jgi:MFS family permease
MPIFYAAALCIFLINAIMQGVSGAAAAHMRDVGVSAQIIGAVVSIQSIGLIFTKPLLGWITDKLGLRASTALAILSTLVAVLLLAFLQPSNGLFPYLYAVLIAWGLPMETIMVPLVARGLFGMKSYTQTLSILTAVGCVGFAVGIPIINVSYDMLNNYKSFLLIIAAILPLILLCY